MLIINTCSKKVSLKSFQQIQMNNFTLYLRYILPCSLDYSVVSLATCKHQTPLQNLLCRAAYVEHSNIVSFQLECYLSTCINTLTERCHEICYLLLEIR